MRRALQVLLVATAAVLVLENGRLVAEAAPRFSYSYSNVHKNVPSAAYSYATVHSSSPSAGKAVAQSAVQSAPADTTAVAGSTQVVDYRQYMPVENTPEVKRARKQFFRLYDKQARLASATPDDDVYSQSYTQTLIGNRAYSDDDHTYDWYRYENDDDDDEDESEDDEEEDDDDDDEEEDDEDDDEEDDDDDDDDEEESDEEDSSLEGDDSSSAEGDDSSSSEEDYYGDSSSSEEDGGEDSSEEGDSSLEDGEDSSSSSSSSSEEDGARTLVWGARGWTYENRKPDTLRSSRLNLVIPQPVTDTPEVKQAKRKFFDLYKTQAEMSFNAPDH